MTRCSLDTRATWIELDARRLTLLQEIAIVKFIAAGAFGAVHKVPARSQRT